MTPFDDFLRPKASEPLHGDFNHFYQFAKFNQFIFNH